MTGSSPSCLPAVRAGPPDRPAPLHPALGGDLAAAVKAAAEVVVLVLQVLDDQLEAAGHRGGVFGVDRGHGLDFGLVYPGPYPFAQRELRAIALLFDLVLRPVMLQCPGSPSMGSLSTSSPWLLIAPISTSAT